MEPTKLFWVVDSPEENEEIFETRAQADAYAEKFGTKMPYTIGIAEVKHYFQEDSGAWNYDDQFDTFSYSVTIVRQTDTQTDEEITE